MSEALVDEIEAINSIYGENTIIPSSEDQPPESTIYILSLPGEETASLRLQFPLTYPDVPPAVLGTHSSGSATRKRGAAVKDLALFRDAVSEVYEPGQVCLFDAIEKVQELFASAGSDDNEKDHDHQEAPDHPHPDSDSEGEVIPDEVRSSRHQQQSMMNIHFSPLSSSSPSSSSSSPQVPPWTASDPFVELKSTFLARTAPVTSPTQAASYLQHLLATDKRVRAATHNITAWRIRGPNGTSFQDCDDDGETAAGGRLLHLMQLMDLWDTMVVVTRWYGGQKLGPRRFALINQAARDAFVKAGLVQGEAGGTGAAGEGGGKKKKGGK
ncbi:ribosomal protein S5 domain 2-type protein [Cladorrhinum samala]|uniref:Ribosomal protein S5 domain 2-type protein n=1 Tax=Cladorrhinum samala TaxID=585594 RepID=A0AAV9HM28_9PEZI|nr:ribosomal protein S5 domain 2-type protein [Cladorrhinum samala]